MLLLPQARGRTVRDAGVASLLARQLRPAEIDATRDRNSPSCSRCRSTRPPCSPGPDGKIHGFIEGYLEADRLGEHMKRTLTSATTADWMARDFNEASKAIGARRLSASRFAAEGDRERPARSRSA